MGATGEQLDTRDVDVEPTLFGKEGDRWIQITIRNPSSKDVELTNHTEELTCADGSTFTAHFRFAGRVLEGAEQIVSDPQIVCPGANFAGGAKPGAHAQRARISGDRYACDPNDAKAPVYDVTAGKAGRIEARSGPVRVLYDLSGGTAEGLYEILCRQSDGTSARNKVPLKRLRKLLDDILGPTATGQAPAPPSSIGSRN